MEEHIIAVQTAMREFPQLWGRMTDCNVCMELCLDRSFDLAQKHDPEEKFWDEQAHFWFLKRIAVQQELMIPDPY